MYSTEVGRVSFIRMSTSELFLVKEDQEIVEYNVLRTSPTLLDFQAHDHQCHPATTAASSSIDPAAHDQLHHQEPEQENQQQQQQQQDCSKSELMIIEKASSHNINDKEESDENDGFKTPTSLDHKIPVIKQCPPAPRKPRRHLHSKRKLSSSSSSSSSSPSPTPNPARRSLVLLDLSREVESLFPMPILADLHRKIKKSRTDHA